MEKQKPTPEEVAAENKKIRMLRFMVELTISLMCQSDMPREEALRHVHKVRRLALRLFPGKEVAFELIYAPRLKRVIREIYGFH